jgi:hypothetical protein
LRPQIIAYYNNGAEGLRDSSFGTYIDLFMSIYPLCSGTMAMGPWHDLHDLLHGRLTELKKMLSIKKMLAQSLSKNRVLEEINANK